MADPTPPTSPAPTAPAAAPKAGPEPKPQITFDEFAKVDLRVAKILKAEPHPNADKLYKLQLDDGSGMPRQICAGIRQAYTAEELVGKSIIIVANLAPRILRGEESRGMLLAASNVPKDAAAETVRTVVILTPLSDIAPGAIVS
ncbi:MAG: methionine--tRNA ligase subunit beta [Planctomycetes bacterium]|nr:methionine--tRNA ligase subunit beta [Planctomycetota bacterium]